MNTREGWKFPFDNEEGLDEVFKSLYGSKKFKAIPVSLLHQMFQWKTAEWEDKEQKVKSFQDFINTYKGEYKYFLMYEFNEGAFRMESLLEYHKLFQSVNVSPNRVIFLTSNWNFSFYDELDYPDENRFHIIPYWWKSIAYFTGSELRNREEIPGDPYGQVNNVWDKLTENFENRKHRNPSKLFVATMESSRGERSYFFDKLKEKNLLKFGHVSYRDMGVYLDNKNKNIMSDVDNHHRFFDTKEYFNDAHISVVMESDVYTKPMHWDGLIQSGRLTEKIMWPLFWGKPFFVIGPHQPINTLQEIGLKTFSTIFDESYDEEDDILIRIDRVVDELERFSKLSDDDLKNELQKTNDIIEYNFNFYKEWSYKGVDEIIDTFFGQRAKELNLI